MVKFFYTALCLLLLPVFSSAQVQNVSYRLSFDPITNLYDCYLHVNSGTAKKLTERVQLNAQLTFLVPTGSQVDIAQSYMPLQDNQNYTGTKPMNWTKANVVAKPASDPFYDYVSVVPQLSPASFYNDLKAGEQVKLFSLKISHTDHCGDDVKLFENGQDLSSTDIGMKGADFRNGFTLGNVKQKYAKNETTVTPALDVVKDIKVDAKKDIVFEVVSLENAQYGPYHYAWNTPSGNTIESKNIHIQKPSFQEYGTYQLVVTDSRGCKQFKNVEVKTNATATSQTWADGNIAQEEVTVNRNAESGSEKVTIYPNPASHHFFINLETEIGTKVDLILTDQSGRNILKTIYAATSNQKNLNIQVSTDNLPAGMYNVLARMNGQESLHRVIIVK